MVSSISLGYGKHNIIHSFRRCVAEYGMVLRVFSLWQAAEFSYLLPIGAFKLSKTGTVGDSHKEIYLFSFRYKAVTNDTGIGKGNIM